jgi:hypothetical protein
MVKGDLRMFVRGSPFLFAARVRRDACAQYRAGLLVGRPALRSVLVSSGREQVVDGKGEEGRMQDSGKRLREQMERQRRQAMGAAWEEQQRRGGGGGNGGCGCLGSLGRAIMYLIILAVLLVIAVACSIFVLGDPFQFT